MAGDIFPPYWFQWYPGAYTQSQPHPIAAYTSEPDFASSAVVRLMGHREIAGFVKVVDVFGHRMIRIEVPEVEFEELGSKYSEGDDAYEEKKVIFKIPSFTEYVSFSAIYSIEPVSECVAKAEANRLRLTPTGQEAKNDDGYESLPF